MATKKNKTAVDDSMVKWPKKLSKAGEYLKEGKPFMKLDIDEKFIRPVLK